MKRIGVPVPDRLYRALSALRPRRAPALDLAGDRDVEWSWMAAQLGRGPGAALDFGNGGSALARIAAERGFDVTAVDLEDVRWPYEHPRLRLMRGDIFDLPLPAGRFDLILNCSAIEHVGIPGRYGVTAERPDGDLQAMARLRDLLRPGGVMLLTIPVGRDAIFPPLHRVYGAQRLPRLLDGFRVKSREFWVKRADNRWVSAPERDALDFAPLERLYALGAFVLERP